MTKLNLLILIITLFILVFVQKNEFQKTIFINVLQLYTAYQKLYLTFKDLYTFYKTSNKIKNDWCKNNVIVFTMKKSLDKYIMANTDYYHLLQKKNCKYLIKVRRLKFVQVLIDESHDIRGVNTTFFNNFVKLATDKASI